MNNSLASFYTDFHSSHFIFKLFEFIPNIFLSERLKRISKRKLPEEIPINLVKLIRNQTSKYLPEQFSVFKYSTLDFT